MDFPLESSALVRFMKLIDIPEFNQLLTKNNIKLAGEEIEYGKGGNFLRDAIAKQKNMLRFENETDCLIDDSSFVTFLQWLRGDDIRAEVEFSVREDLFNRALERFDEEHKEPGKGVVSSGAWRCQYVKDRLEIQNVKILSFSGVGLRSFVAIVMYEGTRKAMRITRTQPSEEEKKIQERLGQLGIAPKVIERTEVNGLYFEIMDEIVTTLADFINNITLNQDIASEITEQIRNVLGQLEAAGVTHGDAHLNNWGLTKEGKLLIFDFDNSSERFSIPTFDFAIVYNALDPVKFDPKNTKWLSKMRDFLFPDLDEMWIDKDSNFNDIEQHVVYVLWVQYIKDPSPEKLAQFKLDVPQLVDKEDKKQ